LTISFTSINDSCLSAFGQEFTLTRTVSSDSDTEVTITGILEAGAESEREAPGDGSTYARLWMKSLATPPQKGDEVTTETTIYLVEEFESDAAGAMWLLLRKDRDVS
jgi:hypothetical protein